MTDIDVGDLVAYHPPHRLKGLESVYYTDAPGHGAPQDGDTGEVTKIVNMFSPPHIIAVRSWRTGHIFAADSDCFELITKGGEDA